MKFYTKCKGRAMPCLLPPKMFLVMKMVIVLLIGVCMQVSAHVAAQSVTISAKNVSLTDVLEEAQRQTGYYFWYNASLVERAGKISIEVKNASVPDFLDACLEHLPLTYSIKGKMVIVKRTTGKKEATVNPPALRSRINGMIVDEKSRPLQGVSIQVKGSAQGSISDAKGMFFIDADPGDSLKFSIIGYKPYAMRVESTADLRIVLKEDISNLGDVVVIGYGTRTKTTLTGSVSVINSEQLADRPAANTTDLLQGLAAGVQVTRSNSGRIANQGSALSIRGVTSRTDPGVLVVIDGIPQKDNNTYALDNINPNDIESISILKDAQAAIYGARAAGGVILVTTKRGKTDKPALNLSVTHTIQRPGLVRESINVLQLVEMMDQAFTNDGQTNNEYTHISKYIRDNDLTFDKIKANDGKYSVQWPFDNTTNFVFGNYNWSEIMFKPAPLRVYNLSVSGRTDKLNYFNSVGVVDQQSMLAYGNNNNKKYFARLKYDYNLTSFLKLSANLGFENQKTSEPYNYTGGLEFWQGLIWPVFMPYTPGGHLYNFGSHQNPIGYAEGVGYNETQNYRIKSQFGLVLTPFRNFTVNADFSEDFDIQESAFSNLGFDMYDEHDKFSYNSNNNQNSAGAGYGRSKYLVANLYANYKFNLNDHHFDLTAGTSHEEQDYRTFSAQRNLGLITPSLPTFGLGSADQQYNAESKIDYAIDAFFSRLGYSFLNKYLVEGTFRYDGSSKFAAGHKWKPFYGLSAGWVISNESFMEKLRNTVDNIKIRASWGQMGNQASIGYYDFISQINIGGSYPMGSATSPVQTQSATLASLPSNDRTWETVETKNAGLDFSILRSRLTTSLDFYVKDDANMFYTKEFPQVLGTTAPSINGAHVRTKGWEIAMNWKDQVGKVTYYAGFNLSNNNSKVIELADSRIPSMGQNSFVEGYPVGAYFGYIYDGMIQNAGELNAYNAAIKSGIPNNLTPGDVRYKDLNHDGKLVPQLFELDASGKPTANSGDLQYIGDAGQHYLFGINLGGKWNNFDLNIFLQGVLKWKVFESNRAFVYDSWPAQPYFYRNTWTPEQPDATYPRLSADQGVLGYDYTTTNAPFMFYNNSYIRLKNIQVGYNIPAYLTKKYKLQQARVYFTGADLYELYNIPGVYDPEKPFNHNVTPMPRRYSFGLDITF